MVFEYVEVGILKLWGLKEGEKIEALKFLGIAQGGILLVLQAVMSYRRATAAQPATSDKGQGVKLGRVGENRGCASGKSEPCPGGKGGGQPKSPRQRKQTGRATDPVPMAVSNF